MRIPAGDNVDRVLDDRVERSECVGHSTRRAGKIDEQCGPTHTRNAASHDGSPEANLLPSPVGGEFAIAIQSLMTAGGGSRRIQLARVGTSAEPSSPELCKTFQCRRITYGDLPWNMCSSSSRSKREHIGAEPGIVGKQSQHVPSPRRACHQANHP